MKELLKDRKMHVFLTVWFGQLISLVGSGLTSFALGVWVYQTTGSATMFAFISVFLLLPGILVSPFAGALVDRWDRRKVMIYSDLAAGLTTFGIAILFFSDQLAIWHIYIAEVIYSISGAFRMPSYMAITALLVPKEHFGRAGGLMQTGQATAQVVSPLLAAMLMTTINLEGVILVDFISFLIAIVTLLFIRVPKPAGASTGKKPSILSDATYGWSYISARSGLLGLLMFFAFVNFTYGILQALFTPMVLSFTTTRVLGIVHSVGASGFLLGGIIMSMWGGPKRRIYGVLGFTLLYGFSVFLTGVLPSPPLLAVAVFGTVFGLPIIGGSSQAIWMSKTPPDVQGRVFAVRTMVAWSSAPLAFVLAGPLADKVFEPLLAPDGLLAGSVGRIIGVGPGRGIGFLFIIIGILAMLAPVFGYMNKHIWLIEDELPDAIKQEAVAVGVA